MFILLSFQFFSAAIYYFYFIRTIPSIACISEVLPLPTAPQTPTKLPSFKDKLMLFSVMTMFGWGSSSFSSSNSSCCFSVDSLFGDEFWRVPTLFLVPKLFSSAG